MAAVPSIGRASRIEAGGAPEADLTRALFEEYANQVFRYCLHQLGSREEAEDAVQSTFLNAFRGIKRGVVPELESAWLFKIAHNVCLSRRRSAWRRGRVESPADFDVIEELAPAPSGRTDELIGLQDVLGQLPETQRRAILLREWQGLSYREIAAELELTQGAVETLIFRARRSLASGLERRPADQKRRAARVFDWSNLLAALKTALVGGSAAAKIAATVAVVSATTVVAAQPVHHHPGAARVTPAKTHAHARAAAHAATPVVQSPTAVSPAPAALARPRRVQRRAVPAHRVQVRPPAAVVVPAPPAPVTVAPSPSPQVDQQQERPVQAAHAAKKAGEPKSAPNGTGHAGSAGRGRGNGNGTGNGQSDSRGNGHGKHDGGGTQPVGPPVGSPAQPVVPPAVTPTVPASVAATGGDPTVGGTPMPGGRDGG